MKGKQNIPMTLIQILDLNVVLPFNVLPKILRISFFAYLTFKNTWDFYIKGNMAMLLGLLGQPQHIKKLSWFFLPELSTRSTYPLHKTLILYPQLFFNVRTPIRKSVSQTLQRSPFVLKV